MMSNKTVVDIFVDGARKGWTVATGSIVPNVLMAFIVIQALTVTGILKSIGDIFAPVMAVFGLPGEGLVVLLSAFMSMGGGAGSAYTLFSQGVLSAKHVTILLPAIFLMGAIMQYMGRLLGTAEVEKRFYPVLFAICIINALLSMLVMRFIV